MPPALRPHALFTTDDPAAADRLGAPFLGRLRMVPASGGPGGFRATLHAADTGSVTLGHLGLISAAEVQLAASAPRFLVLMPMSGATTVQCGASSFEAGPGVGVVVQPGRPTRLLCAPDVAHLVVGIEQGAVLVHLGRLLGRALDQPLVFEPQLDLGACAASRLNLALEMLHAELLESGSLLRSGVGQDQLEEFLMSSLLYGHRSTYSCVMAQPRTGSERRATTAAKQFIEMNLSDRLTLADVAGAAGVSIRTLQAAFRSELRTTPVAYIRSRRLDRARSELADHTRPDPVTVTDVATRWGITHLGRFAAEYRARFGESPSETLRQHRPRH